MHIMKLQEQYFNFIKIGTKKYEIRLNDEKRRKIKIGDFIEFQNEPELKEKIILEVDNLLYYDSFSDLFENIDISELADSSISVEDLKKDLEKFYPIEKQKEYGVVAIELKKNVIIRHSDINSISFDNECFCSLRSNYNNFNEWLNKLKKNNVDVFYTQTGNKITSILILKINENDSQQFFEKGNILKVRTLVVNDNNKGIGTMYFKIIEDISRENNINYIYLTIKTNNYDFIKFVEKNNYKKYNEIDDETVYYKEI